MHTTDTFTTEKLEDTNSTLKELTTFFRDLVVILCIVLIIRTFLVTPFRINGSSMEESYHDKEYILVDKFSYLNTGEHSPVTQSGISATFENITNTIGSLVNLHIGDPRRGDVVVITPHVDAQKEYYIKRVVATPGESIRFDNGEVYIKKIGATEFIKINETYLSSLNKGQTRLPEHVQGNQFTVPEGYYWVMGDNRNNSADSRSCFLNCFGQGIEAHFIRRTDIIGKVFLNFGYINLLGEKGILQGGPIEWTHAPRILNHPRTAGYPELGE